MLEKSHQDDESAKRLVPVLPGVEANDQEGGRKESKVNHGCLDVAEVATELVTAPGWGWSAKPSPHELGEDHRAEQGVGDQVPAPEPPRLLAHAIEPFESEPLPDEGSSADLARENVERSADAVAHWDA